MPQKGQTHIVNVMNQGVAAGMKVMRVWVHSITEGWEMQTAPGIYNEKILHGMDFVMDEAHKRGLKLIWVIADNWYKVGGIDSYVNWGGSSSHADFFSSPAIKKIYKNHITFLANRVNSINGRKYSTDPTIFAWDLANEARCQGCGNAPMQSWISEMCGHVKSVAPNALVGIGYEGFCAFLARARSVCLLMSASRRRSRLWTPAAEPGCGFRLGFKGRAEFRRELEGARLFRPCPRQGMHAGCAVRGGEAC